MFGGGRSIKLINVAGIRVGVDATWFFMLFLLIFLLSGSFQDALHSSSDVAYLTTVATVLLFFASLVIHELGHAFAARRYGIRVDRIELFLFGGQTHMDREADKPGEEFKIAAAGPAGTLLVIVICVALDLVIVGPHRFIDAIRLDGTVSITPVLLSLSWLAPMNILIFLFNIVPAYPLDGGRMARAVVWKVTGDKIRGTKVAARMGEAFGLLLGVFGIWLALTAGGFVGVWMVLLAFMIFQSARVALRSTAVTERVGSIQVGDIMDHEPITVRSGMTLEQALDEAFRRYSSPWLPVIDDGGHFLGISRRYRVEEGVYDDGGTTATVNSVLETEEAVNLQILTSQPLTDLPMDTLMRLGSLIAVDGDGVLRGVLTLEQVRRALQALLATPA